MQLAHLLPPLFELTKTVECGVPAVLSCLWRPGSATNATRTPLARRTLSMLPSSGQVRDSTNWRKGHVAYSHPLGSNPCSFTSRSDTGFLSARYSSSENPGTISPRAGAGVDESKRTIGSRPNELIYGEKTSAPLNIGRKKEPSRRDPPCEVRPEVLKACRLPAVVNGEDLVCCLGVRSDPTCESDVVLPRTTCR